MCRCLEGNVHVQNISLQVFMSLAARTCRCLARSVQFTLYTEIAGMKVVSVYIVRALAKDGQVCKYARKLVFRCTSVQVLRGRCAGGKFAENWYASLQM